MTQVLYSADELRTAAVRAMADAFVGRCSTCGRPQATPAEWQTVRPSERSTEKCWTQPDLCARMAPAVVLDGIRAGAAVDAILAIVYAAQAVEGEEPVVPAPVDSVAGTVEATVTAITEDEAK